MYVQLKNQALPVRFLTILISLFYLQPAIALEQCDALFEYCGEAVFIAAAEAEENEAKARAAGMEPEEEPAADSAKCAAYAADNMADVGEVLRAGCQPSTAQMARLMDNPLGNVAMMLNQFDYYELENDANGENAQQYNAMTILQFPKNLTKDWNLINRIVFNVPSSPIDQDKVDRLGAANPQFGPTPPLGSPPSSFIDAVGGRTTGFGDLYYVGLFSPKKGVEFDNLEGKLVWGVGFDLGFPTASEDVLGANKWTAGPAGLAAYLGPKWKIGALAQQYFDYAGPSNAGDVNLTNIQYLYYYSINPTMSIGAAPNIIMDWEQSSGNQITMPVGLGINKTVNVGKVPVRFAFEVHYSVIRPDDVPGALWDIRLNIIPAAPAGLFPWMTKQAF